jgi:TRAP-type C4-dicarboxylate transport system permease small subunit
MILKKINDILFRISGVISTLLLFGIVAITFAQVICRYFLKRSLIWSSELTVFFLVWMVFLACSMGYRKNSIASLTMVTDRLTPRGRSIAKIISACFMILFLTISFYGNIEIVKMAAGKVSSILKANMQFIYSAWSVAAVLMILYAIEKIADAAVEFKNGGSPKEVA